MPAQSQAKPITLASFKPASSQPAGGLTMVVYGPPGAGKTVFAASAPAPLVLDVDRGARSLSDRADVQLYTTRQWSHLSEVYQLLLQNPDAFQAVVLDSITEIYNVALALAQQEDLRAVKGAGPQLQHHGAATERVVKLVRSYCGLAQLGIHVILTAPETLKVEQLEGNEKGRVIRRPNLPPRAYEGVLAAVDSVVRLVVKSDGSRVLTLRSSNPFLAAKFRAPVNVTVPDQLTNPKFADLLHLLNKEN